MHWAAEAPPAPQHDRFRAIRPRPRGSARRAQGPAQHELLLLNEEVNVLNLTLQVFGTTGLTQQDMQEHVQLIMRVVLITLTLIGIISGYTHYWNASLFLFTPPCDHNDSNNLHPFGGKPNQKLYLGLKEV